MAAPSDARSLCHPNVPPGRSPRGQPSARSDCILGDPHPPCRAEFDAPTISPGSTFVQLWLRHRESVLSGGELGPGVTATSSLIAQHSEDPGPETATYTPHGASTALTDCSETMSLSCARTAWASSGACLSGMVPAPSTYIDVKGLMPRGVKGVVKQGPELETGRRAR